MRITKTLWLLPALLATGCADRPAEAPKVAIEQPRTPPAEVESGGAVNAVSPFGSRDAAPRPPVERKEQVTIPKGAVLRVRLAHAVDTAKNREGDPFNATLDNPVLSGTRVVILKGTLFTGHLTAAKASGRLRGRAVVGLTLDSFELEGVTYPVTTSAVTRVSGDHKRRNAGLIGGGTGVGALLGAIAGGAKGALIGAGAGAAAGTAGAAITGKKNVRLPAETQLRFTLERPLAL